MSVTRLRPPLVIIHGEELARQIRATLDTEQGDAMNHEELGHIVIGEAGLDACRQGYGTTDPEWVGRYALQYGDINRDGTMN